MAPDSETAAPRPALPMRLTRLRVKNFRSIADIDIPLSPLTVLVGPNGSGKSNVVDALRFVRDVFARGLDQAVMDRDGMGVIQRWGTEGEGITIGVTFDLGEALDWTEFKGDLSFGHRKRPPAEVTYEFTIIESPEKSVIISEERLAIISSESTTPVLGVTRVDGVIRGQFGEASWEEELVKGEVPMLPSMQLLVVYMSVDDVNSNFFRVHDDKWVHTVNTVMQAHDLIRALLFYTLNPFDLRQPQQMLKEFPFDEKGRNLAAVLRRIFRSNGSDWEDLRFALHQAVIGFDTLAVETVGGYLATKLIYQTDTSEPRTSYLGQESDGTIRMLGLLAALYQEPAQPFISIEEPEANIHPGALAVLAGVLDEASLRSQVLVTTHSPDMLDHLPAESFLVVEKVGDATRVGPLDAGQLESVRKRLFTPGELLRMEGLQRQPDAEAAS